jgi:pimeloyl-ACP methyl ester carboxylesterase
MFSEHRIELPSGPVHYLKGGSGPPLLHLHPAAGPRISPVIERLSGRHTLLMPTAPGFNGTPEHASVRSMSALADLMAQFARAAIGGPFDLMAESFGGWVALWIAARNPDLVGHLVLQGPAGLRDDGTGGLPADPAARLRALYAHPERAPKETRSPEAIAATLRMRDVYMGATSYDAALHKALRQIKARTLIVMGTRDTIAPVASAYRIRDGIAQSHLSFIYGAAHALEFDAPERVGPLVAKFLERGEAFVVRTPDAA